MPHPTEPIADSVYGFLAVVEEPTAGMVGGLLLIDHRGRPLEFHCTTPVQPTRADEIFCGATLRTTFYCERLGAALLAKATKPPAMLLVNHVALWPIADETSVPVVLVTHDPVDEPRLRVGVASPSSRACLDRLPPETRHHTQDLLDELQNRIELSEPFERVKEAIGETGMLATDEELSRPEDEEPYDLAA